MQALEKATRSRAGDLTDIGLTLALLQIRNAVETGRPFPAEYDALSSLAKTRPEIAAAAAPLAAAAPTGTATHAELAQELHALGQKVDDAAPADTAAVTAAGPARRSTACAAWSGSAAPRRPSRVRRPKRRLR